VKYTETKIKTCCPEMLDALLRGLFVITDKNEIEISAGSNFFYSSVRFCLYCGEKVCFSEENK